VCRNTNQMHCDHARQSQVLCAWSNKSFRHKF